MIWHELFEYLDGKLYWKNPTGYRAKIGAEAGTQHPDGYRVVMVNRKRTPRHRIIWEMFNGEIPEGFEVDHIKELWKTGGIADDHIENLQLVTARQNSLKGAINTVFAHNTSGVTGVGWDAARSRWRVHIKVHQQQLFLGRFNNLIDAVAARKRAEAVYLRPDLTNRIL
ncbi:HNH endonuclease [Salmonella phage St161]|nr:HNH endonuclease [Salmonella phage St161]